jgi:hypothetical protein
LQALNQWASAVLHFQRVLAHDFFWMLIACRKNIPARPKGRPALFHSRGQRLSPLTGAYAPARIFRVRPPTKNPSAPRRLPPSRTIIMMMGLSFYYYCTGWKGKCPEPVPYVREETLAEHFSNMLGRLHFGRETLSWLTKALRESHTDQVKEHAKAILRLQTEYDRLQARISSAYVDKLDGTVDLATFEALSGKWREQQSTILEDIVFHQAADQSYLDEGARLLELASNARSLFARQEPSEKRLMLNCVISNST